MNVSGIGVSLCVRPVADWRLVSVSDTDVVSDVSPYDNALKHGQYHKFELVQKFEYEIFKILNIHILCFKYKKIQQPY